jgi:transcription-repair coupling factor (superfamily II helicase)
MPRLQPVLPTLPGKPVRWGGLFGAGLALTVTEASHQHDGPIVVALSNPRQLQVLAHEINFFLGQSNAHEAQLFPDWETLAYDLFSPHQEIISARLSLLAALPKLNRGIVLTATESLLQRLPPVDYVLGHSFNLETGDQVDIHELRERLTHVGYHLVNQVLTQGEFTIRGGIVDIFAMGTRQPFRLDMFGDEIDTIRYFDPDTQRSTDTTEQIVLLPAREIPFTEASIKTFRNAFRAEFEGDPAKQLVYEETSKGNPTPGIEYYLPLFYDQTATLFDYAPDNTLFILEGDHQTQVQAVQAQIKDRYEARRHDINRKILPPERLYLNQTQYSEALNARPQVLHFAQTRKNLDWRAPSTPTADYTVDIKSQSPYQAFASTLAKKSHPVLIAVETAGRKEALNGVLIEHDILPDPVDSWAEFDRASQSDRSGNISIVVAPLDRGLNLSSPRLEIITEGQLYGEKVFQRRQRKKTTAQDPEAIIRSLAELQIGAPVVHIDHGVGRYQGLQVLNVDDYDEEFLMIAYQGADKLYVPIQSLNLISRFVGGDPELAPLHKLGSPQWERAKNKAREKSYDVAVELLQLQAARQARPGIAYEVPGEDYANFVERFGFEETHDQARAIDEVIKDLRSDQTMDRLVCGDVGFGKTEVAMRAAFIAAYNRKQVIILVPTTLLAQQHFETFRDRFAEIPIEVALLSRFSSTKETREILDRLARGSVDIVIGTHRLIQDDVKIKTPGLVIIDEEHRFGVRQKERLKKLRAEVDILTLTATPIPRTLNMTMAGLREISIIATPPAHRLSIKTFILDYNEAIIREACLREIHRGGQMYFLHNEVKTIQRVTEELQALIPEAKIAFAHGQMSELQLEQVMRDFYHQQINVLVATTIIESGIDIPSANTIVINRADKFGLAQLHQLRGRVGRSHHQAFAYMLVPELKHISKDAGKRLHAIAQLEDLGAGFSLASHDLEIRGAGELLGETQSGLIDDVGFTLYSDYLNRAIASIKNNEGDLPDKQMLEQPHLDVEVHMGFPALFPEDYLPDVHMRLLMYKRISSAEDKEELKELEIESIDRFGLLPDSAKYLFRLSHLKLRARPLGIRKIDADENGGIVSFIQNPPLDISEIIALIQQAPRTYKLLSASELEFEADLESAEQRFAFVERLLSTLTPRIT